MRDKGMSLSERLREKREDMFKLDRAKYSQAAIGSRLEPKLAQATVSQYEREPQRLLPHGPGYARRFFQAYGLSEVEATNLTRELFSSTLQALGVSHEPVPDFVLADGVQINVYGAGTGPAWGDTDILETLYIPGLKPDRDYIGLRATGDSMSPYLSKGEVAVIHRDEGSVQPGDYAAVWLSNDGCVIKRLVQELDDGTLLLESLNPPDGEPRYFQAPDGSRVLGKVIHRLLKG